MGKKRKHPSQLTRLQRRLRTREGGSGSILASGRPARHADGIHVASYTCTAPATLSMIDDPDATCRFFDDIRRYSKTRRIFVDLSAVAKVTPDAIVLLLLLVDRCRYGGRGNLPTDPVAEKAFVDSGMHKHVLCGWRRAAGNAGLIHKQAGREADGQLAETCVDFAKMKLGRTGWLKGTYRTLLECMANTRNHAAGSLADQKSWFVQVQHDGLRNVACFSFVDLGVGIIDGLRLTANELVRKALAGNFTHSRLLLAAANRRMRSVTRLDERGNGIPAIFDLVRNGTEFRRLVIVANRAHVELRSGGAPPTARELKQSFRGTLIYWEIA